MDYRESDKGTPGSVYESDEEPPSMSKEEFLTWKLDPEESHSDWTVEIIFTDSNGERKIDIYHVHKHVLAAGPRKSEYFGRLFQDGGRFAESKTCTSHIELDEIAAKFFSDVLDYMYIPNGKLNVNTENATALHYLGQYFEMHRLRWDAKQFWQSDLSIANCGIYYEHARTLHDERVLHKVTKVCADNIAKIKVSSRIFQLADADFWQTVLQNASITFQFSLQASILITEFCQANEIDTDTFRKLTDHEHLPKIHFDAALKLLELEHEIAAPSTDSLTNLQKRCIRTLATSWLDMDPSDKGVAEILNKLNHLVMTELLAQSLSLARTSHLEDQYAVSCHRKSIKEMHLSVEKARATKITLQKSVERANEIVSRQEKNEKKLKAVIDSLSEEKKTLQKNLSSVTGTINRLRAERDHWKKIAETADTKRDGLKSNGQALKHDLSNVVRQSDSRGYERKQRVKSQEY